MRKRKPSIFVKRQFRYLAHIFCEKLNRTPLLIRGKRQFRYLVALTNHDDPSPFVLPQRQCRYCPAMAEGGGMPASGELRLCRETQILTIIGRERSLTLALETLLPSVEKVYTSEIVPESNPTWTRIAAENPHVLRFSFFREFNERRDIPSNFNSEDIFPTFFSFSNCRNSTMLRYYVIGNF